MTNCSGQKTALSVNTNRLSRSKEWRHVAPLSGNLRLYTRWCYLTLLQHTKSMSHWKDESTDICCSLLQTEWAINARGDNNSVSVYLCVICGWNSADVWSGLTSESTSAHIISVMLFGRKTSQPGVKKTARICSLYNVTSASGSHVLKTQDCHFGCHHVGFLLLEPEIGTRWWSAKAWLASSIHKLHSCIHRLPVWTSLLQSASSGQ